STIKHIEEKHGRTGPRLSVTAQHDYLQDGSLAIREEQDIVYREPTPPKLGGGEELPTGDWHESITPSSTLLFRYSAVTFNGHRIHYDFPYVTEAEGYPGLVVHGPLIATLNLPAFCRAHPQARLRRFSYRGVRLPTADWHESITPSSTLLFRYSAVTFNGHRIHYDFPYVTEAEGYPGLVVHGPLIATLNLRAFCRANPQARLRRFSYRGVRP